MGDEHNVEVHVGVAQAPPVTSEPTVGLTDGGPPATAVAPSDASVRPDVGLDVTPTVNGEISCRIYRTTPSWCLYY